MMRILCLAAILACGVLCSRATAGDPFEPAVAASDVDLDSSRAFHDGRSAPLSTDDLAALLDTHGEPAGWSAGSMPPDAKAAGTFHYLLAFRKPVAIGTGIVRLDLRDSGGVVFRALKPQAAAPGNPANDADWQVLESRNNAGWLEFTCPPRFETRALLCTETRTRGTSRILRWRLFRARLHNLTPYAMAQAERAPYGTDPANVTRGGSWQNAGEDDEKRINRRPVSSVDPSWFILRWDDVQTPAAIRLLSNIDQLKLYAFTGGAGLNPAVAPEKFWERITFTEAWREGEPEQKTSRVLALQPVTTRAIKILILETSPPGRQIVGIDDLTVWSELGDNPAPAPPSREQAPSPIEIAYTLDTDAELAMVIDDATGRRVRNLVAQVERKAGRNTEQWDLKDDNGVPLPVGTYRWKAIYAPPLELRYEMTPYPNVEMHSPNSRPWNREPQDGWLANHGNQCAVRAVGDRVYMAAGGTEGGHAFIETDLTGQKLWGTHRGADQLITDGTTLYARAGTGIARFDAARHEFKDILNYGGNPNRKGSLVGAAANDGKLYLAFNGPVPYFDNATHSGKVDIDNCLPKLRPKIDRKGNYGIPITPQRDFISLFRLGGWVCGDPDSLLFLESTEGFSRQQHILLAFSEPVPLGSLIFPAPEDPGLEFRLSVLKPDAPYPPRAKNEADWTPIPTGKLLVWNCVPVPEGTVTRALRITFAKPGDDLAKGLEAAEGDPDVPAIGDDLAEDKPSAGELIGEKKPVWKARIEGLRLLRCRFRSLLPGATVHVNSGKVNEATGEWDARRTDVLSEKNPGIYALDWQKPQSVRGLSIKEIDGEQTEIDVYTGPAVDPIDFEGDRNWQHVATYRQQARNYYQPDPSNNAQARYIDGMADFGRDYETRAVRLRVVKQWSGGARPIGVRRDRGGQTIEPTRCRVYGVAPLQYVSGEPPIDQLVAKRLAVYDGQTGALESETVSEIDGAIAFSPAGELHAIRGSTVAKVDAKTLEQHDFITGLKLPRLLTFDGEGRFYVYDHDPGRRVVRAYDPQGKYLHDIGTPGPKKAGTWDPASLGEVCAMSADRAGSFWLVYPHENPRRIVQFKTDGTYVREFLGNTHYGGGGVLDPYDKSRVYWKDVVFELDWTTGTSRVLSLLSLNYWEASPWSDNAFRGDLVPVVVGGRKYLVTCPLSYGERQGVGVVYVYDEKTMTMRMAAAVGFAESFPFLNTPDYLAQLGGKPLQQFRFTWTDRNGDGTVQQDEVTFAPRPDADGLGRFDRDLGVMCGSLRYEPKEFLADGTPVFTERQMPFRSLYRLDNGTFFRFGPRGNEVLAADGTLPWSYPASCGVSALYIPPWEPGSVTNQFGISGHATDAGPLGEFFVIHANTGQMNIWTADGLLAGHITYHLRDPRSHGWPADYKRGAPLDGLTLGQEHFHHYFCKTSNGKYYIVAGHNHISIVEVRGLERFKRIGGELRITPELRDRTLQWESARVRRQVFARAPVIECTRVDGRMTFDSMMNDRDGLPVGASIDRLADFRMACNDKYLYLCWNVKNAGPLKNGGDDFHRYFKTGAAVDFQIGSDPDADPSRTKPTAGDVRLLITVARGEPAAVLYRPVVPGEPKAHAWQTTTPAGGTTAFDEVVKLGNVRVNTRSGEDGYAVLVAVPLETLGLKAIPDDLVLKMDWGVLSTEDGNATTARAYWANPMAVGTTDEPTEARMTPDLWGHVRFGPAAARLAPGASEPGKRTEDLEDLLNGAPGMDEE